MPELTHEMAQRIAEDWCDAWNQRDLDAVMRHYADGVEFCSPTVVKRWGHADGWLRGKARLRQNFAIGIEAGRLHFSLVDVLVGVRTVCVIYRRETGQLVSDTAELDDAGKAIRVIASYGMKPREIPPPPL